MSDKGNSEAVQAIDVAQSIDRTQIIQRAEEGIRILSSELTRFAHQAEQAETARKAMENAAGALRLIHDQLASTADTASRKLQTAQAQLDEIAGRLSSLEEQLRQSVVGATDQIGLTISQLQAAVAAAQELIANQQEELDSNRMFVKQAAENIASVAPALAERIDQLDAAIARGLVAQQEGIEKRLTESRGQIAAALADQSQRTISCIEGTSRGAAGTRLWLIAAVTLSLAAAAGAWVAAVVAISRH